MQRQVRRKASLTRMIFSSETDRHRQRKTQRLTEETRRQKHSQTDRTLWSTRVWWQQLSALTVLVLQHSQKRSARGSILFLSLTSCPVLSCPAATLLEKMFVLLNVLYLLQRECTLPHCCHCSESVKVSQSVSQSDRPLLNQRLFLRLFLLSCFSLKTGGNSGGDGGGGSPSSSSSFSIQTTISSYYLAF